MSDFLDGDGETASHAEAGAGAGPRLAPLLLAFLKQAYLAGEDAQVRAMLRDISDGGREPRALGHWGIPSKCEVGEAMAAFQDWKFQGCITMPAYYHSTSHNMEIECFVNRQHPDDMSMDLISHYSETHTGPMTKKRAPLKMVRQRNVEGWYVPANTSAGSDRTYQPQAAQAAATPVAMTTPNQEHRSQPPVTAPTQRASSSTHVVMYAFDGTAYGADYLTLEAGDELFHLEEEDNGWARGRVVKRKSGAATQQLENGWYPASFAEPCERA